MSRSPAVSQGEYHYEHGDFYVTSSDQKRHRRATLHELQALFHPPPGQAPSQDHPAHWYRAQLLHYGLRSSNNKGTAAKRLLDAMNHGKLTVPTNLQLLENELKKEWNSNERKTRKKQVGADSTRRLSGGAGKNKVENNITTAMTTAAMNSLASVSTSVNINVRIDGCLPTASQKATKRKAEGTIPGEGKKSTKRQNRASDAINTPYSPAVTASDIPLMTRESTAIGNHPRKKQTARRAQPFHGGQSSRPTPADSIVPEDSPKPTAKKPTARRGGHKGIQAKPKLGLINGVYNIIAVGPDTGNSSMKLCLQDESVWGEFQLDSLTGVFFIPERPWGVFDPDHDDSHEACFFQWRAVDLMRGYAPMSGPHCTGTMKFLGDGKIEGTFDRMLSDGSGELFDCDFGGERVSGGQTKPPRSAWSLQDEYESIGRNAEGYSFDSGPGVGDPSFDDPPPPYYSDDPWSSEDADMDDVW